MTVPRRLAAGAGAGMTATTLTHPLDVVRLRLALPNSPYKGTRTRIPRASVLAPSAYCPVGCRNTRRTVCIPQEVLCADLPFHLCTGIWDAVRTIVRTEGVRALYKGLTPTLIGIAPYTAINFSTYDLLKQRFYGSET